MSILLSGEPAPEVFGPAGGDFTSEFPDPLVEGYTIIHRLVTRGQASTILAAGTYYVANGGGIGALTGLGGAQPFPFYLDSADLATDGADTLLSFSVGCLVTDVAPGRTFTFGLYPITAWGGGTTTSNVTVGPVVPGSTVQFVNPAANSITPEQSSGDFAFPADGWYILGVAISGALALNSNPTFPWSLQAHNVPA